MVTVEARRAIDVLWSAEEALRSGAAGFVVAEMSRAADLTASRRLQLAAEAGGCTGLLLVPDQELRSNAAETRWRAAPAPNAGTALGQDARPSDDSTRMRLELKKNKRGTTGASEAIWDESAHRIVLVSKAGE